MDRRRRRRSDPGSASATADCDGEVGLIVVTIADDEGGGEELRYAISSTRRWSTSELTVDGEEDFVYEVPENGDYTVDVFLATLSSSSSSTSSSPWNAALPSRRPPQPRPSGSPWTLEPWSPSLTSPAEPDLDATRPRVL